jgi:D-alanyl-D-alanine carboxypeptidase (penicillin-binding protein 5/6)
VALRPIATALLAALIAAGSWGARGATAVAAVAAAEAVRSAPAAAPVDAYPRAATAYVLTLDDRAIWARALDAPRPPASLTKLLAAIVLLEAGWQPGATLTVGARAASVDGTRIGLRAGETLRADAALTAMLVRSANDACMALAEHAAGTAAAFVARMNARAATLGLRQSHFGHPCGLDAPGQHSTAGDLLQLAQAAMLRPEIARRVALPEARIATLAGRELAFTNGNLLVGRVAGVIGVKSGFTSRAGKCVIALAVRGTHRVWLVMLDAPNRWWVAAGMIEAAFEQAGAGERG